MTPQLDQHVAGILLDVEGTTTPIDFVYQVLFPYAVSHAAHFLEHHTSPLEVRGDLEALRQENLADTRQGLNPPPFADADPGVEVESAVAYMEWLTARDRKSPTFKSLQGKIWERGYRSGHLQAEVFPDVPRALARWQQQGRKICIFSSGSVLAQKLLFAHTVAGDLTPHIGSYFDTTTAGSKADPASYRRIAEAFQRDPSEILFVSDVTAELDAAQTANLNTLLCVRPGNRAQPANPHVMISSFDEIFP